VPVVAAAAAALPETVGAAGLTFIPRDAEDLARQIRRVFGADRAALARREKGSDPLRIREISRLGAKGSDPFSRRANARTPPSVAIVSPRYGGDFAGGAEASLRTIAEALHGAGHRLEVFTTCARREGDWANDLPEGTEECDGVPVHRFRIDETGWGPPEALRSSRLIEALDKRADEVDAIIVGPYLIGLTQQVAKRFPEKTLLLPCFHDEPAAREYSWRTIFANIAGILYHSAPEQAFAEAELALNQPGAEVIGTALDCTAGDARRGRALVGSPWPYVVYCGRYSAEKGLPGLLEFVRDYAHAHPDRFAFVFMGEGEVEIPPTPGLWNLGFTREADKRDILAGAAALIHWSERESLSLVALEAWAQGVPVLCNRDCAALMGHFARGGGGRSAHDARSFAAALDDLWEHPDAWRQLGRQGQEYVRASYGSRELLVERLRSALGDLAVPLVERMRIQRLERAARFERTRWRAAFAAAVEKILDAPPRVVREQIDVEPRVEGRTVSVGSPSALIPVRATNRGSHAALPDGPGAIVLRSYFAGEDGQDWRTGGPDIALPGLLMPGQSVAAAVPITVPASVGEYQVVVRAERAALARRASEGVPSLARRANESAGDIAHLALRVSATGHTEEPGCCTSFLEQVQAALGDAHAVQRLPDDYTDVCTGRFAKFKRWIKRKFLGNFKRTYVDVLSRQQSEFNRHVLTALQELAECCGTLDHAQSNGPATRGSVPAALAEQLRETREAFARLQEHLERLEGERGETGLPVERKDVA
jgi:glycosyltransferase involved in cell wall biosynthesis